MAFSRQDGVGFEPRWLNGQKAIDVRAIPVYIGATFIVIFLTISVILLGFDYDKSFISGNLSGFFLFISTAIAARFIGFNKLAGTIEAVILLLFVSALTALAAFVAASLNLPLVDEMLEWTDQVVFGHSHDSIAQLPKNWPFIHNVVITIYNTLSVQPFLLIPALFFLGQDAKAWAFLSAWTIALMLCVVVSPFAPAYGNPPYVLNWIDVFDGARDGALRTLEASVLTGIITFPSFHAAGAVLLAWASADIRFLRFPLIALNTAVAVSAVLVGGHYIIDIFAGIVTAILAIVAARYIARPALDADNHSAHAA